MTVSLCMIVKNEEKILGKCLELARSFADEIIVVDTGSEDGTKRIAETYTDKIYDFSWTEDFAAARNFSFSKASMDYIMWLDADDTIKTEDLEKIIELKKIEEPMFDVVLMKYAVGYDESGRVTAAFYRERLLRRSKNYKWVGAVHEYIEISGEILNTDICIMHAGKKEQTDRNLKILEKAISLGKPNARELYYYATELYNNGKLERAFQYYLKFMNSDEINPIYVPDACIRLAAYYVKDRKYDEALSILIRTMEFGIMKPEVLCHIGNLYKEKEDYERAIAWYELIFKLLIPKCDTEMHLYELGGFIPCVDLCYCYFKLGKFREAVEYNERAAAFKPDSPIIEYDRRKFREAGII